MLERWSMLLAGDRVATRPPEVLPVRSSAHLVARMVRVDLAGTLPAPEAKPGSVALPSLVVRVVSLVTLVVRVASLAKLELAVSAERVVKLGLVGRQGLAAQIR